MAAALVWQKSSFSGNEDAPNCVEITAVNDAFLLRESEEPSTMLAVSGAQLAALLRNYR